MTDSKTKDAPLKDLRDGQHVSLTVPEVPLAGAEPLHVLENPRLATPGFTTPPGQATHE